ncbi:MAG: M36 family metallopeptidase [Lysobacteraceae bacterium]
MFALGFDEGSGNFQQTNFGGTGLGGDRVLADAQDSSGTNNANFATPPDGTSGRMQMFRFTAPTVARDGGLDAVIVIHELTHGTSNRLIGNAAGLDWDPGSSMGEGWSDFYALSLLNGTNAHDPDASYAAGAYATYKLGGLLDNYLYAIRRFPYSTDNSVNPLTWADVDDVTFDLSGGIAASPLNFSDSGGMEVHNAGEIWALSLWEVRSRIIADPNGASGDVPTGNHTMLQLVTDAMKMTPISPSFEQARDALFDADCATNGCANEESIWRGFADRGLGFLAATRYNVAFGYTAAHLGVTESFELPRLYVANVAADVAIDDSAANNNGTLDPGEPVLLAVRLTNPWRATGKAATGATATLSTATPGVTILDGNSSYGAIAPQASATGDSFTILLDQTLPCGSRIDFSLSVTSNLGTAIQTFSLRVGAANGTDPVITYTRDTNPDLATPDNRGRAAFDTLNIADDFVIADVDLRLDNVTHTFTGDLTAMLRSPDGIGVDQMSLIGGLVGDGYGDNIVNMVMDDDVASIAANDMVQAPNSAAPYTKSWLPVFNSPWAVLAGFPPADPLGTLSRLDGTSTLGTWSLAVSDQAQSDTGTLRSWSMLVTPVHFDCTVFVGAPAPAATKTVSGTFIVGGTVTYTVTITNSGTGTLADNPGDEFTDVLPASLTLVSATASSGTATATIGTNTVTWNGTLAQLGGAVTITIQATINSGTQGMLIINQGTVSYDSDGNGSNDATTLTDDPAPGGASDPTVFQVGGAQLSATKTVTGTFTAGGSVTYTIIISNAGVSASLDNVGDEFTDALPAGLSLSSAAATSGTASTTGNTVTWNGSVPASGSVTLTIQASINAGTPPGTTISNQGTLNYDADLNGSNETTVLTDDPAVGGAADPTVFITQGAQVSATKTVTGTFTQGSTVVYTIVLANAGNTATADNPGDELVDVLPTPLALLTATATAGQVLANVGNNTVTWNGSIPAGGSATITIHATILTSGTITNQATFAYDGNLDGTNESTGVSDDPTLPGSADPTEFSAISLALVPATSPWTLLLLALALLGLAAVAQRRR